MSFLSSLEDRCGGFATGRMLPPPRIDEISAGVFFDLIECLIQRDIGYATQDVREAYEKIKLALVDEGLTRVVIIVHSQGGIVMSMALDNLLSDLPRECAFLSLPLN
jgi:hypothetical protein